MSLVVVSTPIGNPKDITLRALESLKEAEVIVCEERRPAETLLKKHGIINKELRELNEHSKTHEVAELVSLCKTRLVALITDCGTPGFCDPGADLVAGCCQAGVRVDVNPGASSLLALISLSGVKLNNFYFAGFLPAEKSQREREVGELKKFKCPIIIMDTPYRLKATLKDLVGEFARYEAVLGVDLTGEKHQVHRGKLLEIEKRDLPKAPFILLLLP